MKLLLPTFIGSLLNAHRDGLSDTSSFAPIAAKAVSAEKFIFQSVNDDSEETRKDIFDTSEEMIDFGIFHLPSPVIWLEDPVDYVQTDLPAEDQRRVADFHIESRYLHLAVEADNRITIKSFLFVLNAQGSGKHAVERYDHDPSVIDLDPDRLRKDSIPTAAEFAIRQMLVTLCTPQANQEKLTVSRHNLTKPTWDRNYDHTVITVRTDAPRPSGVGEGQGDGTKRRYHFVRGYIWGRHTRLREEQRWVSPQWRGDLSLGYVKPKHYEVG